MEDKQKICNLLCEALKATRNHDDIVQIKYREVHGEEFVTVMWEHGRREINVTLDSGTAMIRDIVNHID